MDTLYRDVICQLGDGGHQEDVVFLVARDDVIRGGTGDGASVPYSPNHPLQTYNGKTGAELAARCYQLTCEQADPRELFERTLIRANDNIRLIHQVLMGLEGTEPGSQLHGLCFGAFEISPAWTRVVLAGDAQVLIQFKNGNIWMSRNEMREHDNEMYSLIARYKEQAATELGLDLTTKDKEEEARIQARMWEYFYEPLCWARNLRVNTDDPKGYSLMNGHPEAPLRWQKANFRTSDIKAIGSVTDGLMQPRDEFAELPDEEAAATLLNRIEECGSLGAYADRLTKYEESKPVGHVKHMEKAGVLVRLA